MPGALQRCGPKSPPPNFRSICQGSSHEHQRHDPPPIHQPARLACTGYTKSIGADAAAPARRPDAAHARLPKGARWPIRSGNPTRVSPLTCTRPRTVTNACTPARRPGRWGVSDELARAISEGARPAGLASASLGGAARHCRGSPARLPPQSPHGHTIGRGLCRATAPARAGDACMNSPQVRPESRRHWLARVLPHVIRWLRELDQRLSRRALRRASQRVSN
jgi:hypothetical protein